MRARVSLQAPVPDGSQSLKLKKTLALTLSLTESSGRLKGPTVSVSTSPWSLQNNRTAVVGGLGPSYLLPPSTCVY